MKILLLAITLSVYSLQSAAQQGLRNMDEKIPEIGDLNQMSEFSKKEKKEKVVKVKDVPDLSPKPKNKESEKPTSPETSQTQNHATDKQVTAKKPQDEKSQFQLPWSQLGEKKQTQKIETLFPYILSFLSILSLFYFYRKIKSSRVKSVDSKKQLEILSVLPISPKRQLLLIKAKEKDILISSTESGVHVVDTQLNPEQISPPPTAVTQASIATEDKPQALPPRLSQQMSREKAFKQGSTQKLKKTSQNNQSIKKTEDKESRAKPSSEFLTNLQKEVSRKKDITKKTDKEKKDKKSEEAIENVTKLIREKLKNFHSQDSGDSA